MSFLRAIAAILIVASPVFARARASSYCTQGGQVAITNTIPSATKIQQSYPQCSIQVFYSGGAQGYVTTSANIVTFSSGIPFNANSGWPGLTITLTISGTPTPFTIQSVTSAFVLVLTASAGTNATPIAYSMPATAPAAIFSNNTGTALANPFVSSTTGYWGFFADNGTYDISASGGGIPAPITWSAVSVIDPFSLPLFISSRTYIKQGLTFYQACASAAAQGLTLVIDQTWYAIPTSGTCAATVQGGGGLIQPASGQTVTLTGSFSGDLTQHFDFSAGGIVILSGPSEIEAQWAGVKGDGATDDTVAVQYAMEMAVASSKSLNFPAATYAICGVKPWASGAGNAGNVTMYGDGPHSTMFVSTAACVSGGYSSPTMIQIYTSGAVSLHDFGIDSGIAANASSPLAGAADINISGSTFAVNADAPSSVTIDKLFVTHGTVTGLTCQPCQNVRVTNSDFAYNWWQGLSIASVDGGHSPPLAADYLHSYALSGNTYRHNPIGLELNFLIQDISESADTYTNSSLYLTQMPHAHYAGAGLSFDGAADYGCGSCGTTGIYAAVYNEGSSDVDLGTTHIANLTANAVTTNIEGGAVCQGSNVNLGSGAFDLPCNNVHYHDITVDNSEGYPVLMSALSSGGVNPTMGVTDSIIATHAINVGQCQVLEYVNGFDFSLNYCDSAAVGGFDINSDQNGVVKSNHCHNCNTAGGTTYTTGTLTASDGSASLTGNGTTWTAGMAAGGITIQGTTYQILSRSSNTALTLATPFVGTSGSGIAYSLYYGGGNNYVGLLINGVYTFNIQVSGNVFQSDSGNALYVGIRDQTGLTPGESQITYDTTNVVNGPAQGMYLPVPTTQPTLTSCTNGTIQPTSTNTNGLIAFVGSNSTCTINFAPTPAFTTSFPACTFTSGPGTPVTIGWGAGSTNTAFIFTTTGNLSGQDVFYNCQGAKTTNQYPIPQ